jgi:hypothetical protein
MLPPPVSIPYRPVGYQRVGAEHVVAIAHRRRSPRASPAAPCRGSECPIRAGFNRTSQSDGTATEFRGFAGHVSASHRTSKSPIGRLPHLTPRTPGCVPFASGPSPRRCIGTQTDPKSTRETVGRCAVADVPWRYTQTGRVARGGFYRAGPIFEISRSQSNAETGQNSQFGLISPPCD